VEQRFVSWSFKCAVSVVTTDPRIYHSDGCDCCDTNATTTSQY